MIAWQKALSSRHREPGWCDGIAQQITAATLRLSVLLCLLCGTSCRPAACSAFLASFNPSSTLNSLGSVSGLSYSNGSSGTEFDEGPFTGLRIEQDWDFSFQGSHKQLLDQLDRFMVEVERQLSSSGVKISGSGTWGGDFSGFSFHYSSGARKGFIRVTGVSFESDRQGFEILAYEYG